VANRSYEGETTKMNFSSLLGLCFGAAVLYTALVATTDNMRFFLDMHGILIVCGGTAAAASISFPIKEVFLLLKVFLLRVLGRHHANYQQVINQLLELNKKASIGISGLNEAIPALKHEFLKEAVSLMATGVLTEAEIRAALEQRLKTIEARLMHEANMFRTIGRFPPAFGLLATTLGMIGLLQKIGQPDSQKLIGPAMSVGLIGTLYGIALANLIFIPIAENLTERTQEEVALRRMIIEGVILLKSQVNPMTLREQLNSYVLPKQRVLRRAA
jgi:chemotaxis protein MotA